MIGEPRHPARLRDAMEAFRTGAVGRAALLLGQILDDEPADPKALLLLAMLRDDGGDVALAHDLFQRYLALHPGDGFALYRLGRIHARRQDDAAAQACFAAAVAARPDDASALNELGAALYRMGQPEQALAAFNQAMLLNPVNATTQLNRAKLLAALHRPEAAAAFAAMLELEPRSASEWCDRATASLQLGHLQDAEAAARRAIGSGPADAAALDGRLLLAEILECAARPDEAQRERIEVGRQRGVVTRRCLGGTAQARILLVGGAGCCNLPTEYLIDRTRFDVTTIFLPPDAVPDRSTLGVAEAQRFDLAFSIVGDADAGAPFLGPAEALLRSVSCPVLNPPWRIPPTRRDRLADCLADIPGLVTPRVMRLSGAALRRHADTAAFDTPWLVRPAGLHGGVGLVRAETPAQVAAAAGDGEYYVSQFHDYSSPDGWFRKYRFAFVDGALFPVHLAIGAGWMVHYWRVDMADWMQAEEAAFLSDYRAVLGPDATAALQGMAVRLGLDFGGVDCTLLRDGRVLVFEANATMLVHANGVSAVKRTQAIQVRDAMSVHILRRCHAWPADASA